MNQEPVNTNSETDGIPGFVIVGAPKAGTTALYEYLKAHPSVFLPRKEIHFFCTDLTFSYPLMTINQYLDLFKKAHKKLITGDASVWYLFSKAAAGNIKRLNPNAKIIIMLRDPVDMVYSLHSEQYYNGNENIANFEEALEVVPERINGLKIPKGIKSPHESLYYTEVAKYYEQVKRYMEAFPKEQILMIKFDDLQTHTESVYNQVLRFLDLAPFDQDLKAINPNKTARSRWLVKASKNPPQWIKKIVRRLLPHESMAREKVTETIWRINTKYEPRKPLPTPIENQLRSHYAQDVAQLEKLTGINLNSWRR